MILSLIALLVAVPCQTRPSLPIVLPAPASRPSASQPAAHFSMKEQVRVEPWVCKIVRARWEERLDTPTGYIVPQAGKQFLEITIRVLNASDSPAGPPSMIVTDTHSMRYPRRAAGVSGEMGADTLFLPGKERNVIVVYEVPTGTGCGLLLRGPTTKDYVIDLVPEPAPVHSQASYRQSQAVARGSLEEKLDAYMEVLRGVALVERVAAEQSGDQWRATITVADLWHVRHYQVRLQDAQTLWKAWALTASPQDPDCARISIVDHNGNEVGGSRVWGGSLIWVQDK